MASFVYLLALFALFALPAQAGLELIILGIVGAGGMAALAVGLTALAAGGVGLAGLAGLAVLSHVSHEIHKNDQVCYGKYGCFDFKGPFNRPHIPLPQKPEQIGFTCRLVTRADPKGNTINDADVAKLQASGYDGSKKTIIIIHGWTENPDKTHWVINMKQALIDKEDVNVIIAKWTKGAQRLYGISAANTRLVGSMVAELIKFLNHQTGNNPSSFHLIGFSMGAQIAGYAGRRLQDVRLGRITGLDPAGPFYIGTDIAVRLDKTDADFVDVIHSDGWDGLKVGLGTTTKSGHLDFWPNGGIQQPGCGLLKAGLGHVICDHYRAPNFYVESILSQCPFISFRCSSWDTFRERDDCMKCGIHGCPEMGHNAIKYKAVADGNFYLYTNEAKPYCVHSYALVTFKTNKGNWLKLLPGGHNPRINIHGTKGSTGEIDLPNRAMAAGSTEQFVAPIKMDLGTLTSIDVRQHNLNLLDAWFLDSVHVFVNQMSYTACYKGILPVFALPVNKKLHQGISSC